MGLRKGLRRRARLVIGLAVALAASCLLCGGLLYRALGPVPDYPRLVSLSESADLCIDDVSVFVGDGAALVAHQRVVVEGDRIVAVEDASGEGCPAGHAIVDGRGHTLLPGFIDAHVHLMAPAGVPWSPHPPAPEHHLEAWLACGVTTVYDLGGPSSLLADLAQSVDAGEIVGPRVVHGDIPITIPGGHPIPAGEALARFPLSLAVSFGATTVADADEAREAVAARDGLPYVKIIRDALPESAPEMDNTILRTLIEEAHARDLRAFVHIGDEEDAAAALGAGADLIAHMPYHGARAQLPHRDDARAVATLHGFEVTLAIARGELTPSPLARRLHPPELLDPVTGDAGRAFLDAPVLRQFADTLERAEPSWPDRVARLRAAGVQILVGTDAPLPGVLPGSGYHEEIAALARAGVPPAEIFRGATWGAATLLDDDPDFGAVRAGMRADLVMVDGDPLADPSRSAAVALVIVNGRRVRMER